MKKKIAVILLVTVMTAGVFAGCGNSVEGNGKVQAAIADAGNSQEDSESEAEGAEIGEPAPEATAEPTAEPTAQPAPEATAEPTAEPAAEPTEEPASTAEPEKDTESGTAADSFQDIAANSATDSQTAQQGASNQSAQSARSPQQSQGNGISAGTAASANDSVSGSAETQTSNYLSQAFVNYLNRQRSAAGLNQITWNSGLESLALTRAQEISNVFEHPIYMQAPEIILAIGSSDPAEWYNAWYESQGHRLVLEDNKLQDGACGVYQVEDYFYIVFVCSYAPATADEIKDSMDSGEMQVIDTFTTDDGVEGEVWGSDGTGVLTEEDKQTEDWSWVNDLEW